MKIVKAYKNRSPWEKAVLWPAHILHAVVLHVRHFLFDKGFFSSRRFQFPIIVIGNLSLGGTGKTPCSAYLFELLQKHYSIATLSRGYKRKTKGYLEVNEKSVFSDVGDESYWLKIRYPNMTVCVCEQRVDGLIQLIQNKPFLDAVILDDAYQHRKIDSAMNILLTEYSNLFCEDRLLPLGKLRDIRSAYKRASIIIVTKSPQKLENNTKKEIEGKLQLLSRQSLFFSTILYNKPYPLAENSNAPFVSFKDQHVLLVSGIANPQPLLDYLTLQTAHVVHKAYSDHFHFTQKDVINLLTQFEKQPSPKMIVCTEKDATKLRRFQRYWKDLPIFVLPIRMKILNEKGFTDTLHTYINSL